MNNQLIKNSKRGFTLAEMLVTVGVFAITMAISSSIFINVNNLQLQTANMSKLQNEGRYVLEKIGKEIRGRELDYSQLSLLDGFTDRLVFKPDEFGQTYRIYFNYDGQAVMIETSDADGLKNAQLSSSEVSVDKMQFRVSPLKDPYDVLAVDDTPLEQSRVTIIMTLKNIATMEKFRKTLFLQTTISSKNYR